MKASMHRHHITFGISKELLRRLKAQNNPDGIGAEIRARLEASFRPHFVCGALLYEEWKHCPVCGRAHSRIVDDLCRSWLSKQIHKHN